MPTLDVGGTTIAYTDTGPPPGRPDAPVVVFGHGLLFGGWVFDAQVEALRGRYRCVTLDWRGQGASPPAAAGYDMDTLTGDAVALIRSLGTAPVHWVGLSMGGFVGLRIAARHGERLRSLTLLDTSAGREDPRAAPRYRMLAWLLRVFGPAPVLGRVTPLMFGPAFRADPAGRAVIAEWARRLAGSNRAGVRRAVLGVVGRPSVEQELARIGVPTLVVVGADDLPTPPRRAERIAGRIPGARLEILPRCGHTSPLEQPAATTGLIEDFVASVDGRRNPL